MSWRRGLRVNMHGPVSKRLGADPERLGAWLSWKRVAGPQISLVFSNKAEGCPQPGSLSNFPGFSCNNTSNRGGVLCDLHMQGG